MTIAVGRVATSHAAVQAVLRQPGSTSDQRHAAAVPDVAGEALSKVLLFMDAPNPPATWRPSSTLMPTPESFGRAAGAALTFTAYLVPLFDERRSGTPARPHP